MTKRFFAILRYSTVVAMISSAFVFSGCDGDDDPTTVTFDGSIYAFITQDQFQQAKNGGDADKSLDSLVMYLEKFPDLKANLTGTSEFTLFAPSNTAFKSLTALPGLKDPDQVNPSIIAGVLAYHFVQGKKLSTDLTAGSQITTIYKAPGASANDFITVNTDGTLLTGSTTKNIEITTKDQLTTNGVVHITKTVLIPNATGSQLASILGSLAATVLLGKDFTLMAYFIGMSETGVTDPAQSVTATLAKGEDLTLLAIPNLGFQVTVGSPTAPASEADVLEWMGQFTPAEARAVLKNHIVAGQRIVGTSSDDNVQTFKNGGNFEALSGKALTSLTGQDPATCKCVGVVIVANGGASVAPIVKADLDTEIGVNNGVMQVVAGVILD